MTGQITKLACLLALAGGIGLTTSCRQHQQTTGAPAFARPQGGRSCGPRVELMVSGATSSEVRLHWRFVNDSGATVWVARSWGSTMGPSVSLPLAFLVPPNDILFVSGDFQLHRERGVVVEGNGVITSAPLAAGRMVEGEIVLPIPYRIQNRVTSPFEHTSEQPFEKHVESSEAAAVQCAIQYWTADPNKWEIKGDTLGTEYRLSAALAVIRGEQLAGLSRQAVANLAVSPRCVIRVPLTEKHSIYYLEN